MPYVKSDKRITAGSSEILIIFCNYLALLKVEVDMCLPVKRSTVIMNVNNLLSKILSTFSEQC